MTLRIVGAVAFVSLVSFACGGGGMPNTDGGGGGGGGDEQDAGGGGGGGGGASTVCPLPKTVALQAQGGNNFVATFCWGTVECNLVPGTTCDFDGGVPDGGSLLFNVPAGDRRVSSTNNGPRITATSHGSLMMGGGGDSVRTLPDATDVTITVSGRILIFRYEMNNVTAKSFQ